MKTNCIASRDITRAWKPHCHYNSNNSMTPIDTRTTSPDTRSAKHDQHHELITKPPPPQNTSHGKTLPYYKPSPASTHLHPYIPASAALVNAPNHPHHHRTSTLTHALPQHDSLKSPCVGFHVTPHPNHAPIPSSTGRHGRRLTT